jgi:hypothetical protein
VRDEKQNQMLFTINLNILDRFSNRTVVHSSLIKSSIQKETIIIEDLKDHFQLEYEFLLDGGLRPSQAKPSYHTGHQHQAISNRPSA